MKQFWGMIIGVGHWNRTEMMDFGNDEGKRLRSTLWVILTPVPEKAWQGSQREEIWECTEYFNVSKLLSGSR